MYVCDRDSRPITAYPLALLWLDGTKKVGALLSLSLASSHTQHHNENSRTTQSRNTLHTERRHRAPTTHPWGPTYVFPSTRVRRRPRTIAAARSPPLFGDSFSVSRARSQLAKAFFNQSRNEFAAAATTVAAILKNVRPPLLSRLCSLEAYANVGVRAVRESDTAKCDDSGLLVGGDASGGRASNALAGISDCSRSSLVRLPYDRNARALCFYYREMHERTRSRTRTHTRTVRFCELCFALGQFRCVNSSVALFLGPIFLCKLF